MLIAAPAAVLAPGTDIAQPCIVMTPVDPAPVLLHDQSSVFTLPLAALGPQF